MQSDAELMEKLVEFARLGGDVFRNDSYQSIALKYAIYKGAWYADYFSWETLMRDVFRNDSRISAQIERLKKLDYNAVPNLLPSEWLRLFALLQPRYMLTHAGVLVVAKKKKGEVKTYAQFRSALDSIGQAENSLALFVIGHLERGKAAELLMHESSFRKFDVDYLKMQREVLPAITTLQGSLEGSGELATLLGNCQMDFSKLAPAIRSQYERKIDYTVSPVKITKNMLQQSIRTLLPNHATTLAVADTSLNAALVQSASALSSTTHANLDSLSKQDLIRTETVLKEQIEDLAKIRLSAQAMLERQKEDVRNLQLQRQQLLAKVDFPRYYKEQRSGDPAAKATPNIANFSPRELYAYRHELESDLAVFQRFQVAN